jgi:hypothetical protein
VSFITVAITGLAMLFGYHQGSVGIVHKVASVAFVLGSLLHVRVNWKATTMHLRKPTVVAAAALFLVASAGALLPLGGKDNPRKGLFQAAEVVLDMNIAELASVTHQPAEAIESNLKQAGLVIQDGSASLRTIAQANRRQSLEVVSATLAGVRVRR